MLMIEEVHPPPDFDDLDSAGGQDRSHRLPGFEQAPADQLPGDAAFLIGHIDHILDELDAAGGQDRR